MDVNRLPRMDGKVVMVTGATQGIGMETARGLARLGATVVIVGRNAEKGARVVSELVADTGNAAIAFLGAELSRQAALRQLADEFRGKYSRLDVLVNNAGAVSNGGREVTPDGFEKTWAVNHLAYFLLTHLLLGELAAATTPTTPARIVNVSSSGHKMGRLNFDDLQAEGGKFGGFRQYSATKLANVLFTRELAWRLQEAGLNITANAAHPGFVPANFPRKDDVRSKLMFAIMDRVGKTPAQGAETSVYLAASPEVEGITGQYFANCKPASISKTAQDDGIARRLWQVSLEQVGIGGDYLDAVRSAVALEGERA